MPAEGIVGRILRLPGHGAIQMDFDEATSTAPWEDAAGFIWWPDSWGRRPARTYAARTGL